MALFTQKNYCLTIVDFSDISLEYLCGICQSTISPNEVRKKGILFTRIRVTSLDRPSMRTSSSCSEGSINSDIEGE